MLNLIILLMAYKNSVKTPINNEILSCIVLHKIGSFNILKYF